MKRSAASRSFNRDINALRHLMPNQSSGQRGHGRSNQRFWVHKAVNVLNRMPNSVHPKAKGNLHEIWQAETKADANNAFDEFIEKYGAKYSTACECLKKDRDMVRTFYDFPARHWSHLRTTNPIESTFATIHLRHRKTKGSGTRRASLAMSFKLAQSASKKWRRLNSHEKMTLVIPGRFFKDGIIQDEIGA